MLAARDRELPLGPLRELFPWLTSIILAILCVYRLVDPLLEAGQEAIYAVRRNDHQVFNVD